MVTPPCAPSRAVLRRLVPVLGRSSSTRQRSARTLRELRSAISGKRLGDAMEQGPGALRGFFCLSPPQGVVTSDRPLRLVYWSVQRGAKYRRERHDRRREVNRTGLRFGTQVSPTAG